MKTIPTTLTMCALLTFASISEAQSFFPVPRQPYPAPVSYGQPAFPATVTQPAAWPNALPAYSTVQPGQRQPYTPGVQNCPNGSCPRMPAYGTATSVGFSQAGSCVNGNCSPANCVNGNCSQCPQPAGAPAPNQPARVPYDLQVQYPGTNSYQNPTATEESPFFTSVNMETRQDFGVPLPVAPQDRYRYLDQTPGRFPQGNLPASLPGTAAVTFH